MPELPTLAEAGVPGYQMSNWIGIVAPAAPPPGVVEALRNAFATALRAPQIGALLNAQGIAACGSTAREFAAFMTAERARWRDRLTGAGESAMIKSTGGAP